MEAVAVLGPGKYITFHEQTGSRRLRVMVHIDGLSPGKHGFHIHEAGDLRDGCTSLCAHFNPHGKVHGGIRGRERHMGDLGNIIADRNGRVRQSFYADLRLRGKYSILGRSVIVHADEDDLGLGGNAESLKTGNAGKRILCGVIGYAATH